MKVMTILTIFFLGLCLLISGCGSSDEGATSITGNVVAEPTYNCKDLSALEYKTGNKQDRVDAEARELLTKTTAQGQRVQKFKVMKLDRELQKLKQDLAALQEKCS